jgi:1,4-dihydroxy-2-naphthoyl-CoA synthase
MEGFMSFQNILFEKNKGIGRIIINRPDKRNALNRDTRGEIREVLDLILASEWISYWKGRRRSEAAVEKCDNGVINMGVAYMFFVLFVNLCLV